jgi:hypothetical protein
MGNPVIRDVGRLSVCISVCLSGWEVEGRGGGILKCFIKGINLQVLKRGF